MRYAVCVPGLPNFARLRYSTAMSESFLKISRQIRASCGYIRLSVTDRCDFRCVYTHDRRHDLHTPEEILSLEELCQVAMHSLNWV